MQAVFSKTPKIVIPGTRNLSKTIHYTAISNASRFTCKTFLNLFVILTKQRIITFKPNFMSF
jgi:hypothetical protein